MNNKIKIILFLFLFCLAIFRCFYGIEDKGLILYDEKIYFDVIKGSAIHSSNLPTLFEEETPFFLKPPLYFLVQIFISRQFGLSLYSLRLLSAISGFFITMTVFYIGLKKINYGAGLIAGFILLTTQPLFTDKVTYLLEASHNFRSISLDGFLLLFIMLAYVSSLLAVKKKNFILLTGIFCAISFLIKGPIFLVIFFIPISYLFLSKKINIHYLVYVSLLFLAIVLPWYIYEYKIYGLWFLNEYFGYQLFHRIIFPIEGHNESTFFYFSLLMNPSFYIWGWPYIVSISYLCIKKKGGTYFEISLLFIPLSILFIFTLTMTKLSWYIVPIYPFSSLLIAYVLNLVYKDISTRIKILRSHRKIR